MQQGTSTVTLAYENADRRTSLTLPNTNSVTYAYNAASELTTLTYKKGATTLGTLLYTYDAAGNRIKTGGTFARSNLPPALTTTSYNANNQQTTFGTNTETYDLNGNLATVTDAGVTTTYTWNVRNQLTGIGNTGFSASFTYDSFGRRTGKTVQGTTTNFVYDGLNPVQEKNGGTVTANLLTGLGIDEYFTRTDGVGTRGLLPDALGSTVALGDATGTLQTQSTYEPFGYVSQTGQANTNSYKYTGREDDGSGLDYYRARYYHPRLQRFISEDPLDFSGDDTNLYAYVNGDPINLDDPTGETPWGLIFAGGDLGWQLYQNGGSLRCVDWKEVGLSLVGGGLLNGLNKGAFVFKKLGSHTWGATSSWMNRQGIQLLNSGQQRHHWLLQQNQGLGPGVSNAIKNQPWNTNPISASFNNWLGQNPSLAWLGGPSWAGEIFSGTGLMDQEAPLVDVNNAEVALLLIEREKAMIPVNTKAFSMSQQSGQRLNSLYTGALVVYRDGSVDAIDRIELQGFYGVSLPEKLQSAALGAHYIKTYFRKHPLSLEHFKELITSYLPADSERGAPYLPLSQPLNAVLEAVRAGTSFERVFDALHLPDLEDCLDVL